MVDPELIAAARQAFPEARAGGGTTYGMTESGGSATLIGGEEYLRHPLSVGRAVPACELAIHAPDENGVGEILIRTPSAMSGYWRDTDSSILDKEGWIHSGDLGHMDQDGYLYVSGRSKDIIIRGGENVSASVVEQALLQHPDIEEVAVIGLPHPDLGEEIAGVVVVKADSQLSASDLSRFLSGRLGYFEVPTRWWVRTQALPVNASGKVVKPLLTKAWKDQPSL
jgi:long-chain acyl-CoA synthetase